LYISELLQSDPHEDRAPIECLQIDKLIEWCRGKLPDRAVSVARIVPLFPKGSESTWHPLAEAIIDTFGDSDEVLRALSQNMYTFSWAGSLVPYWTRARTMAARLECHPIQKVRRWAATLADSLTRNIEEARKQDEETSAGII
jgi:hypothetical protein